MTTRLEHIQRSLARLHEAAKSLPRPATFMEVCGTHTMSAFRCGLHSLTPGNVTLLSGPGCPVCVTAQSDIDLLIEVATVPGVSLCTYGDVLRVPGAMGSLEKQRSRGASVKVVYSTLDAVRLAQQNPKLQVVFGAVGFETTAPATAAAVLAAKKLGLSNFSVMTSHKRVVPAMLALLQAGKVGLDGFLCPGHVSVVIGSDAYRPVVEKFGLSCVICGFEDIQMAQSLATLTELLRDGRRELVNEYPEAVTREGNRKAQALLDEVFEPAQARWRGVGVVPDSGLSLRENFREFDAQRQLGLVTPEDHEPKGCKCGAVITGLATPADCKLFEKACTPVNPIGPCMVSGEGTCQAWFKYGPRRRTQEVAS